MAKKAKDSAEENQVTEVNDTKTETSNPGARSSGIVVNPLVSYGTGNGLPLVVVLPPGANKAQVECAKALNGYAYSHPVQWEARKEKLLQDLEALANIPDMPENPDIKLSVGSKL